MCFSDFLLIVRHYDEGAGVSWVELQIETIQEEGMELLKKLIAQRKVDYQSMRWNNYG